MLMTNWVMTLFARIFSLDSLMNIWDVIFVHQISQEILIELTTAVFVVKRAVLLQEQDGFGAAQKLKSGMLGVEEEEGVL